MSMGMCIPYILVLGSSCIFRRTFHSIFATRSRHGSSLILQKNSKSSSVHVWWVGGFWICFFWTRSLENLSIIWGHWYFFGKTFATMFLWEVLTTILNPSFPTNQKHINNGLMHEKMHAHRIHKMSQFKVWMVHEDENTKMMTHQTSTNYRITN